MVNQSTAVARLHHYILSENIRPMKKWSSRFRVATSNRLSWYLAKIKKQIRFILGLISGNDLIEMLKDILHKKEREKLAIDCYKDSLNNLVHFYRQMNLKERHKFIRPIKNSGISFKKLRELGYPVSSHLWETCLNTMERSKGGGSSIPLDIRHSLKDFLRERSNIAANKLIINKDPLDPDYKKTQTARFLEDQYSELFKTFQFSSELSLSSFYKYANMSGEFKKPHRWTDLCDYCENAKALKDKISIKLKDLKIKTNETFEPSILIEKLQNRLLELKNIYGSQLDKSDATREFSLIESLVVELKNYETILFHKNIARIQRIAYNKHRTKIDELQNKILIEIDFKQKIMVGLSPRQKNSEFYNQISRTCLGFGIYYVDSKNEINSINFDLISSDMSEDARSVVRGFRILRMQDFFINIEKPNYIVWADCGKHFRNSELVGYLLKELAEEEIHVSLNFFCEKHGKNLRDSHFSCVSKFIQASSLRKRLTCSSDIVDAINDGQRISNENTGKNVTTIALAVDYETDLYFTSNFPFNRTLTIQNIESYYNYRTIDDDYKLVTSILSDENDFIELKLRKNNEESVSHSDYIVLHEPLLVDEVLNLHTMRVKHTRINCALNKIKNTLETQNQEINKSFFDYFGLNDQAEDNVIIDKIKPIFCSNKKTAKKKSCNECTELCSLPMEMILNPLNTISQADIYEELMIHHHPSSRIIKENGKSRTRNTREAAEELAAHYEYVHNKKRPVLSVLI